MRNIFIAFRSHSYMIMTKIYKTLDLNTICLYKIQKTLFSPGFNDFNILRNQIRYEVVHVL